MHSQELRRDERGVSIAAWSVHAISHCRPTQKANGDRRQKRAAAGRSRQTKFAQGWSVATDAPAGRRLTNVAAKARVCPTKCLQQRFSEGYYATPWELSVCLCEVEIIKSPRSAIDAHPFPSARFLPLKIVMKRGCLRLEPLAAHSRSPTPSMFSIAL